MSNQNKTKDDKKKIRKARFAFFVIPNAILLIICAILGYAKWNELKSHWPLFAISGIIILLILNRICYSLYKAREERDLTKLDPNVGADQVKSSYKLLRYAAAALAVISFITTAQGLKSFVFPETWQAYTASFAVQSILLVFNFLFFPFYVRIKKPERFPAFFRHILIYCIVFLFIGSLIVSSTFSYVFIANNTYKDMRPKNSNITIEKFLTEEAYKLSAVNDKIVKQLGEQLSDVSGLKSIVERQDSKAVYANDDRVKDIISLYSYAESEDLGSSFGASLQTYRSSYESVYKNYYLNAFKLYEELSKEESQKEALRKINYDYLDGLINSIERPNDGAIAQIDRDIYILRMEHSGDEATNALGAFSTLRKDISVLKEFFKTLLPFYPKIDQSAPAITENERNIQAILSFVYSNEYDPTEAKRILGFLYKLREGMLTQNAAEAGKPGSTSQPSNTSESDNPHKELHDFTEAFNSFVKYAELKERIKGFIDNNLSITYYIKSEGESDELAPDEQSPAPETTTPAPSGEPDEPDPDEQSPAPETTTPAPSGEPDEPDPDEQSPAPETTTPAPSGEGRHTYKTVSEAEWTKQRKQDFVEFISCLKGLPDLEQYKQKEDASVKNEEEASALMKDYDQQAVLEEAYTLNRDLLEKISDFEKAINYFKYDFRLMAVLSAIMALFMDLASFLTGGFMFGASFFDELKKPNKQQTP